MKKIYTLSGLLAITLLLSSLNIKKTKGVCGMDSLYKSAGPPSCYAGELPNQTTCASQAGCHDDAAANTGLAHLQLSLSEADSGYTPGQIYTVKIALSRTGLVRGGFQIIALQDNDITTSPGTIILTDSVRMFRINAANPNSGGCATDNKTWIQHTANGIDQVMNDTIQWQFNWQAPSTNVGTITFYLASLDSNLDHSETGDFTHTTSKTIAAIPITSIKTTNNYPTPKLYPNPTNQNLYITELPIGATIRLIDAFGRVLIQQKNTTTTHLLDMFNIIPALYFLEIEKDGQQFIHKVIRMN